MADPKPKIEPTLSLPLTVAKMLLSALFRHQTALAKLQDVISHGDCLPHAEFDDALMMLAADRELRMDIASAIAQVPHDVV